MRNWLSPFRLLCLMGALAIFSSTMAKSPALPLLIRSLGVPLSTVGFIAAASTVVGIAVSLPAGLLSDVVGRRRMLLAAAAVFAAQVLSAALAKPVMGRLSDRHGRVPMIAGGLVLGGLATGLILLTSSYPVFFGLIVLFGLGLATVTASTSALVADLSQAEGRGGALGMLSSIMDIGHSTGPVVSGVLIGAWAYERAFGLVGAGLAAAGLAFWAFMRPRQPGRPAPTA